MTFEIIIYRIIIAILIFILYMASRKIKNQDNEISELIKEGSKASNNFRLKGIKIDQLERENKKLKDVG